MVGAQTRSVRGERKERREQKGNGETESKLSVYTTLSVTKKQRGTAGQLSAGPDPTLEVETSLNFQPSPARNPSITELLERQQV